MFGMGFSTSIEVAWLGAVGKSTSVQWLDGNYQMFVYRIGIVGLLLYVSVLVRGLLFSGDRETRPVGFRKGGVFIVILLAGLVQSLSFNYAAIYAGLAIGLLFAQPVHARFKKAW